MGLGGLLLGAATIGLRAAAQPEEQVIKILARRFTYTPNKLTLKKGVPVVLELTTAELKQRVTKRAGTCDRGSRATIVREPSRWRHYRRDVQGPNRGGR